MSNSTNLSTVQQKPKFSVAITTKGYQTLINNTLRDPERAKRFIASITAAVAVNPELQKCEAGTILAGALLGESLNLSPSPQLGQYYLVPFECKVKGPDGKTVWMLDENGNHAKSSDGKWLAVTEVKAQFVLGYKGYLQLALRSGAYSDLDVIEIREGEYKGRNQFTGKHTFAFIEDDDERETKPVIGYMAYFEYVNGFRKVLYWSREKMSRHADQYSPAYSAADHKKLMAGDIPEKDLWKYSSFWYKDFDGMAKKTMLRQLISKWGIMSTELCKAFEQDNSIAEIASGDNIVITPEDDIPIQLASPEVTDVVEQINLDDL